MNPPREESTAAQQWQLIQVDSSHYDMGNEIARGGQGRIFIALDRRLRRRVAIKELIGSDPVLRRRFEREALITARLQHPAIVPVHEAGAWDSGQPFYAMKFVSGKSLADLVSTSSTLAARMALLPNVITVVDALAFAHSQGVIHRDLKPQNIIGGAFGETVVIDWGLAKMTLQSPEATAGAAHEREPADALDATILVDAEGGMTYDSVEETRRDAASPELTVAGAIFGTPAYMPPEQARGEEADARSDVYSLGAILYYVLSGRPPHKGANSSEVLHKARHDKPAQPPLTRGNETGAAAAAPATNR